MRARDRPLFDNPYASHPPWDELDRVTQHTHDRPKPTLWNIRTLNAREFR